MSEFNVKVFQLRGSSYELGVKTGMKIKGMPVRKVLQSITKPSIDMENLHSIFSSYSPHLLEELEGLAHGTGMTMAETAALFSGYEVPKTDGMGCSSIATSSYYVRNYDFSPALYDGVFSLIQPSKAFATAGYTLQILGRHDGVNEHGLVAGFHFVSNDGYTNGISSWTAVRMVLDTCRDLDEAVYMLKEIPHAACYNFSLGDVHGNMAVVESTPENVVVKYGETTQSCVNHFKDDHLSKHNRSSIEGSLVRENHLQDISNRGLSHDEMFNHFKSLRSPLFFTDYDNLFGTLHTFSYCYKQSRIFTTLAQGKNNLDINFKEWVNGQDSFHTSLLGCIQN